MNIRYFSILFFALCTLATIHGQDTVRIALPDTIVTGGLGTSVCLPVTANEFEDIGAFQFPLTWDSDVLRYDSTMVGNNPLSIPPSSYSNPTDSTWIISSFSATAQGQSVDPGTVLFSLCFSLLVDEGSSVVTFNGNVQTPIEFIKADPFGILPFVVTDGSVTMSTVAELPVLPGDTNRDSLVNADDLLNIGLGFNFTGPVRENASSAFVAQPALPWQITTPLSGTDFAHVDADGNGLINAIDQAVMEQNYGQAITNFQPPVPPSGVSSMPRIVLVSDSLIGGQVGQIEVFLGDEENPVNVGYGLSFSIQFSPTEFDLNSLTVNFADNFLGSDLLTFNDFYPNEPGLLEIAVSRTNQQNSALAGGKVCTITVTPLVNPENVEAELLTTPYRYIDADENETVLLQSIDRIFIETPTSVREPDWASALVLSPNPVTGGEFTLTGLTTSLELVQLIDLTGRVVLNFPPTANRFQLENAVPGGTYFLRLVKANAVVTRKLVIQ